MKLSTILMAIVAVLLVSCGKLVSVDPGEVGKIMTSEGLQDGLKFPSSFRLPIELTTDTSIIKVETTDESVKESFELFMPKDQLTLQFDIRGVFAVVNDEARLTPVFTNITSEGEGRSRLITFDQIYSTYGRPVIRNSAREVLAAVSIQDVLTNRQAINHQIEDLVRERLKATPLTVKSNLGLAAVTPPDVIVKANEAAKKREIEVQEAEADRLVAMAKADAALEVAKKQQEIDLLEAETQALSNKKLAEGFSEAFMMQRSLRALEALAYSDNKVFILPTEAIKNPLLLLGMTQNTLEK